MVIPSAFVLAIIATTFGSTTFSYDFHGGLYDAARDILHGHSPYRPGYLALEAGLKRAGGTPPYIDVPVYPPVALIAVIPFALLPFKLAGLLFAAVSIAGFFVALRLLGVRDWRCYGAALASWPMVSSVRLGALSPLLVLGAAAAWRCRDQLFPPAIATASIIVAKLFPWTIAIWLLATRRFRAFALTIALTTIGVFGCWALIGFHGMASYPQMLSNLSFIQQTLGVSMVAATTAIGGSITAGKLVCLVLSTIVLLTAWKFARTRGGDQRTFGLTIMACLLASTNVWPHYLALVFVPIALISPTLSPLWLVPMLAWLGPTAQPRGDVMMILPYLLVEAIVIIRLCVPAPLGGTAVQRRGSPTRAYKLALLTSER